MEESYQSATNLAHIWKDGREEDAPSEATKEFIRQRIEEAKASGATSMLVESTTQYHYKYYNPWWPRPDSRRTFSLTRWLKDEGLEVTYHTRSNARETILDVYINLPV